MTTARACREWRAALEDVALGASVPDGLGRHVRDCAGCDGALQALRERTDRLDAALSGLTRGGAPSPGFHSRVLAAAAGTPSRWSHAPALAAALLVVVVLCGGGLLALRSFGIGAGLPQLDEDAVAISAWRSPTESLLRSPATGLLAPTQIVGDLYFPLERPADDADAIRRGDEHETET